jgi:hypothetical protein
MATVPQRGDFVRVRSRRWLVEDERPIDGLKTLRLACVDDDAQGEVAEVLWDAEIDGSVLGDEGWASVANLGTDDPSVFSAYFRTLRWNTATAADRDLFQAPFRAGIHQDAYQLLPLRKALRLPRVNLLIADDVGAGKTVEAGLVLREMLLRRRIDFVLVAAPAGMVRQWQEELDAKFGLSFTIVDREYLGTLRRERGYSASPWASGSRFIISHSLLADETYVGGLRDLLGNFRPRALLILDEAHHAAPASGSSVEHFPELRHVPAPALRSAGCLARWQETANARRRQTAYILAVPKSEHETTAWQAAIETCWWRPVFMTRRLR